MHDFPDLKPACSLIRCCSMVGTSGGVRSILLLSPVSRCPETIDVCIWRMLVFISVVVTVWGSVRMFVHPVAVLNATFCMTCSLLMLFKDARGDHMEEAYSRAGLMTAL